MHRATSTKERLRHIERLLFGAHRKLDSLLRAANIEILMELEQMADFKELADEVSGIKGVVESASKVIDGFEARVAELEAGMNDEEDKAQVRALASDLRNTKTKLAEAIANDPGISTGGV